MAGQQHTMAGRFACLFLGGIIHFDPITIGVLEKDLFDAAAGVVERNTVCQT